MRLLPWSAVKMTDQQRINLKRSCLTDLLKSHHFDIHQWGSEQDGYNN